MPYERYTPLNTFGSHIRLPALGAPPGAVVEPQLAELMRDVALSLGLPSAGVVTPWAGRVGDLEWQEIKRPDTNVASFSLRDSDLDRAKQLLFGQQLPFITVITGEIQPNAQLENILQSSPYELFETQAVYRQDDSDVVPRILFLHWLLLRPVESMPTRNVKSMDQVASEMHGMLHFSQQVPVETSTIRTTPTIDFQEAFDQQEPEPITLAPVQPPPSAISPSPAPTAPAPSQPPSAAVKPQFSYLGPVLVCLGVAAATVAVVKAVRR